jgi:CHASE3 domain sensor protein
VAVWSILVTVISLAAIWVVYRSLIRNIEDQRLVDESQLVLRELETLLGPMIDVETGTRGYLITGQTRHLGPYERSLPAIQTTLRRLGGLLIDPEQRRRIEALRPQIDSQLLIVAEAIKARRENILTPGRAIELTDRGKGVMDEIRLQIATTQATASARLDTRSAQAESSARTASRLIWVAMGINVAILALLFRQIASEMALRTATERALRESEQRFRGAFESAAFGMAIISLKGCWTAVNSALGEILDCPGDELIGASVEASFNYDDKEEAR